MARYKFECIDAHTCGNPVRLVKTGGPELEGQSMSERRQHFIYEYDWIRTGLMFEPRGHDMMSGSILYPPSDPNNDVGVLFIETSGCLPMCGHGTIGTITIAVEEGLVIPRTEGVIKMEAPAGLVTINYEKKDNKVSWVQLTNVPSYLAKKEIRIKSPDLGELIFDVSYGGNYYAIIDPQENFKGVQEYTATDLIRFSLTLRMLINEQYPDLFIHPEDSTIRGVSHIMWTGTPLDCKSSGRNAVFYGDKAIDRSPCGTGTSARLAQLHAKGQLGLNENYIHESFIGSTFTGKLIQETIVGTYPAVIPQIKGWAKVYGYNTIYIDDEDDPYAHGFQVI